MQSRKQGIQIGEEKGITTDGEKKSKMTAIQPIQWEPSQEEEEDERYQGKEKIDSSGLQLLSKFGDRIV